MRRIKKGSAVAVSVTHVDGIVVARSSFASSIRYRSAVLFGRPYLVSDEEKITALTVLTEKLIPGRISEIRSPTAKEVAQTMVLTMAIDEWSLKISDGWPEDDELDREAQTWAGVVHLGRAEGRIEAAPDLARELEVPPSVRALAIGAHG
jgi:nitroimidazol reductase NimA-like FMN-containing flavoprotein (pyridoxamine 5'-phosphate oxidase superfamily)